MSGNGRGSFELYIVLAVAPVKLLVPAIYFDLSALGLHI